MGIVYKSVTASARGNTVLWKPGTGKRFRLIRFMVQVTANATLIGGSVLNVDLLDGKISLGIVVQAYVPPGGGVTALGGWCSPWFDLASGVIGTTIDGILSVNLDQTLATGSVNVIAMGSEE